jgi:hypothetical protein
MSPQAKPGRLYKPQVSSCSVRLRYLLPNHYALSVWSGLTSYIPSLPSWGHCGARRHTHDQVSARSTPPSVPQYFTRICPSRFLSAVGSDNHRFFGRLPPIATAFHHGYAWMTTFEFFPHRLLEPCQLPPASALSTSGSNPPGRPSCQSLDPLSIYWCVVQDILAVLDPSSLEESTPLRFFSHAQWSRKPKSG